LTRFESVPGHLALDTGGALLNLDLIRDGRDDVVHTQQMFQRSETDVGETHMPHKKRIVNGDGLRNRSRKGAHGLRGEIVQVAPTIATSNRFEWFVVPGSS
jgi:hypothetical protein